MNHRTKLSLCLAGLALAAPGANASCGSAFCAINTDWNLQSAWTDPGTRVDLRYEHINQDQPLAGRKKVSVGEIPSEHDEVKTVNRNWLASFDTSFGQDFSASIRVPLVDRRHDHIHDNAGTPTPEAWSFREIGDIRILGRRQFPTEHTAEHNLNTYGVTFGLKLPTGKIDVANEDGELAERTLQSGTGTTDALVGAYFRQSRTTQGLSWFVQGTLQSALNSHQGFRPGDRLTLDLGAFYGLTDAVGLAVQINTLIRDRDAGPEAEPDDSGGHFVYLSPGISYSLGRDVQVYGFVQLPLYQFANGVQLVAKWASTIGVSARF